MKIFYGFLAGLVAFFVSSILFMAGLWFGFIFGYYACQYDLEQSTYGECDNLKNYPLETPSMQSVLERTVEVENSEDRNEKE